MPRVLDVIRHPDNFHVTYLIDCTEYAHGTVSRQRLRYVLLFLAQVIKSYASEVPAMPTAGCCQTSPH